MESLAPVEYQCVYCGEINEVDIDISAGNKQSFTEDCVVCCRPNSINCVIDADGNVTLAVEPES
jgi:hypothetical protein